MSGGLNSLYRSSWCILQPQPTGLEKREGRREVLEERGKIKRYGEKRNVRRGSDMQKESEKTEENEL